MPTYHAQLVGVNFRPAVAKEQVKLLQVGDELQLEREPDNEYDPNAIKVINRVDDKWGFLGYIERGMAAVLAPMMDEGTSFTATVNHRLNPWSVLLVLEPQAEAEVA